MEQPTLAAGLELRDLPEQSRPNEHTLTNVSLDDDGVESNGHSLPPCDGGKVAWRILLAMFVFEALLWGPSI